MHLGLGHELSADHFQVQLHVAECTAAVIQGGLQTPFPGIIVVEQFAGATFTVNL